VTALEINDLHKSYGELRALDGVTFSVGSGEIFGFVGSNGAGKTTTMRITLGVLASDSGEVRWNGHPIGLDDRRRIGYMPSERGLYPRMKVGEQLQYLARLHGLSKKGAEAAARKWTERLGIDHRLGDEVQTLSLGNQQRVQLAAALVHDPEVLVLDEPFSGLDPAAVDVMSAVLRETAATGVPVVFSSHQLELVERLCHRVGIIQAGRMVTVGSIDELRSTERPRFAVTGAPVASWIGAAPGAVVIESDGDRALVETSEADGQSVLRAALAAGPVREFAPSRPSLTDLYRLVVATSDSTETAQEAA